MADISERVPSIREHIAAAQRDHRPPLAKYWNRPIGPFLKGRGDWALILDWHGIRTVGDIVLRHFENEGNLEVSGVLRRFGQRFWDFPVKQLQLTSETELHLHNICNLGDWVAHHFEKENALTIFDICKVEPLINTCPWCRRRLGRVNYGFPRVTPELRSNIAAGLIELGGCTFPIGPRKTAYCLNCEVAIYSDGFLDTSNDRFTNEWEPEPF